MSSTMALASSCSWIVGRLRMNWVMPLRSSKDQMMSAKTLWRAFRPSMVISMLMDYSSLIRLIPNRPMVSATMLAPIRDTISLMPASGGRFSTPPAMPMKQIRLRNTATMPICFIFCAKVFSILGPLFAVDVCIIAGLESPVNL